MTDYRIQLLEQYYNVCNNLSIRFPLDYTYLITHPLKINEWDIKRRIKEAIQSTERKTSYSRGGKKNRKRKPKKYFSKKEMHHSTIVTSKRENISRKKMKKKKKKPKRYRPRNNNTYWSPVIYTGMTQ